MNKQISTPVGIGIIVVVAIIFIVFLSKMESGLLPNLSGSLPTKNKTTQPTSSPIDPSLKNLPGDTIQKFTSLEEFKDYIEKSKQESRMTFGRGGGVEMMDLSANTSAAPQSKMAVSTGLSEGSAPAPVPDRFSQTNTQVLSIDEPDIVKTNGKEIFFSQPEMYRGQIFYDKMGSSAVSSSKSQVMPPYYPDLPQGDQIRIIKATPASEANVLGKIDKKSGEMLLFGKILIVISENKSKIYGFDITDPKNPVEKWNAEMKEGNNLISARLYGEKIYVATQKSLDFYKDPCPIYPLTLSGSAKDISDVKIECNEIYHPLNSVPSEATYSLLSLDATTGNIENKTSFVGPWSDQAFYMSEKAIYLSYSYSGNFVKLVTGFVSENKDLFPTSVAEKLAKIDTYDISESSKSTEVQTILDRYLNTGEKDEQMRIRNEMSNRIEKYSASHNREGEFTGIAKVNLSNMEVSATGKVPGRPLNQFSFDEYNDNLRVATTIEGSPWQWMLGVGGMASNSNFSDVYVLDKNLKTIGAVKDLGKGESIYSTRFLGDKGYVVTFRQTDPFFVLDLKEPTNPLLKGELKIPGYSSYLHPLPKNQILGVGSESGKVKITLFDVTDPTNPKELNTYKLDEYYSEVSGNHHAFLLDEKHGVFFLPGSLGGYVFSYQNDGLKLVKSVSDFEIKRAVYINDNLYILGNTKMIVLDENNWEKVKEIEL